MESLDSLIAKYPNSSLLITGHSLGGAISAISTADLYTSKYSTKFSSCTVYTIGQPRVGNDIFAKWVSGFKGITYYRVVNENDVVPHRKIVG
jgi:predicted lipase